MLVAVLIAPFETGLIRFARLNPLRARVLDPKPHRRVGRDIVVRQPAKLVGLGKGFDGVLGQHVVADLPRQIVTDAVKKKLKEQHARASRRQLDEIVASVLDGKIKSTSVGWVDRLRA